MTNGNSVYHNRADCNSAGYKSAATTVCATTKLTLIGIERISETVTGFFRLSFDDIGPFLTFSFFEKS